MQRLQREGRVAQPRVAVIPVALAPGRLGQRGRQRGDCCAGRHVGEALDRERRALDRLAPAVVGHARASQPVAPVARRGRQPGVGVVEIPRHRELLRPGERAEDLLALAQHVPRPDPVALDADRHVALQADRLARAARVGAMPIVGDRPLRRNAPVVEDRFARQLDLDLTLQAHRDAHQQVLGVLVGRRPRVRRHQILAAARADRQCVAHDHPACRGRPGRQQRVRTRLVEARRRHVDPERPEAKRARLAVEQRAEHAGRVEARNAEPVDRAVGRDQRAGVAVREERVVGDRRERRGRGCALRRCIRGCAARRCIRGCVALRGVCGCARRRGVARTHRPNICRTSGWSHITRSG